MRRYAMNNQQLTIKGYFLRKVGKTVMLWMGMLLFVLPFAIACQQENTLTTDSENGVALNIQLTLSGTASLSRGVSDDPRNEKGTWTSWEKLVDGSLLYRVTLLLVDADNTLVGLKDWNDDIKTTLPQQVGSVTFTGLKSNKTYKIIAIANYSAIDVDGHSWGGLVNFPNVAELTLNTNVTSVINQLNNYTLPSTGTDFLAAKNPQPLTLVQEITTPTHGMMQITGELVRTYARFRLEIENRSESKDMKINSLSFGGTNSKFGVSTEPLMSVADHLIPDADGNLAVSSSDAITSFSYSSTNPLTVPKLDLKGTPDNSRVAFDAYLYECKNTEGFEYSLNVGYGSVITETETVYRKGDATTTPTGSDVNLYMIGFQKGNTWYYLTANSSGLSSTTKNETVFDVQSDPVFWEVIRTGDNVYTIKSVSENKYISLTNYISLQNNSSDIRISEQKMSYNGYFNTYYLKNSSNSFESVTNSNDATMFSFFPITEKKESTDTTDEVMKNFNIPLYTLIDGISNKTTIIRRNDFINVLVTISYNENSGNIDFHVSDWTSGKGGMVEFD